MDSSLITLIILSLFLGFACWMIFMWAVQKGEFNDLEGPKHRMLEDEDDELHSLKEQGPASAHGAPKRSKTEA